MGGLLDIPGGTGDVMFDLGIVKTTSSLLRLCDSRLAQIHKALDSAGKGLEALEGRPKTGKRKRRQSAHSGRSAHEDTMAEANTGVRRVRDRPEDDCVRDPPPEGRDTMKSRERRIDKLEARALGIAQECRCGCVERAHEAIDNALRADPELARQYDAWHALAGADTAQEQAAWLAKCERAGGDELPPAEWMRKRARA